MERSTQAAVRLAMMEERFDVGQAMRDQSGNQAWQPSRLQKEKWAYENMRWTPAPEYCKRFITADDYTFRPAGQRREFFKQPVPATKESKEVPGTNESKLVNHPYSLSEPLPESLPDEEPESEESLDWGAARTPPPSARAFDDDDDAPAPTLSAPCLAIAAAMTSSPSVAGPAAARGCTEGAASLFAGTALDDAFAFALTKVGGGGSLSFASPVKFGTFVTGGVGGATTTFVPTLALP
jgi:hypothetical protein